MYVCVRVCGSTPAGLWQRLAYPVRSSASARAPVCKVSLRGSQLSGSPALLGLCAPARAGRPPTPGLSGLGPPLAHVWHLLLQALGSGVWPVSSLNPPAHLQCWAGMSVRSWWARGTVFCREVGQSEAPLEARQVCVEAPPPPLTPGWRRFQVRRGGVLPTHPFRPSLLSQHPLSSRSVHFRGCPSIVVSPPAMLAGHVCPISGTLSGTEGAGVRVQRVPASALPPHLHGHLSP